MNYILPILEGTSIQNLPLAEGYLQSFKAKNKESVWAIDSNGNNWYLLGLGKASNQASVINAVRSFIYKNKKAFRGDITFRFLSENEKVHAEAIVQGFYLAEYEIGYLKTEKKETDWFASGNQVIFEGVDKLGRAKAFAQTQMRIMQWCDAPGNYKTPQNLAAWIQTAGKESGFEVGVYEKDALEQMGFKALLGVGRGSVENPPVFCVLKYSNSNAQTTLGLVGKGVTFDTGGVSLKPGDNMNYMKSDMGGLAAVAGTIEMAARLQLPVNLIGAVAITENCIDSYAIKPGDVIGSYSGKTIEVINTDAEGRLILADALSYITRNFQTDILIDLATLTGNAIAALGYKASALMTENDDLANDLYLSGLRTGEKVWRMPLWEEYSDCLHSDIADVKNLAASPIGGAINAAKFLEVFTEKHGAWAHLDIAGTAFGDTDYGKMKSATGYGLKLLIDYIEHKLEKAS